MLHRTITASLALVVVALAASEARADGAQCGTDPFAGPVLDAGRWSVLRPAGDGPVVSGGQLRVPLSAGALAGTDASARNVVLQPAPSSGWTASARVGIAAVDAPGERAGLVLWRGEGPLDNTFSTATFTRTSGGAPRFEAVHTDGSVLAVPLARSTSEPGGALPAEVTLRLRSDGSRVGAAYSLDDGASWTAIGETARIGGPVRVGLLALGTDGTATFDDFALSCGPEVTLTSAPERGTAILEMGINATLHDDRDDEYALDLAWDFGDGTTGDGSQARLHKYVTPGTYRPTLWATDSDGNVTSASRTITVLASEVPCPAWSDEFAGNGLDPRWTVLRPVPTGLDVGDGRLWLRPYPGELPGAARNLLVQPAPAGPWTMTTAVDVAALGAPGDRAGLVLWRGDAAGDVAALLVDRTGAGNRRVLRQAAAGEAEAAIGSSDTVQLRVTSSGTRPAVLSGLASTDGETWTPVGGPFTVAGQGQLQLGIAALGSSVSDAASFQHLHVDGEQPCGAPDGVPPETTATLDRQADGAVRVALAAVDDATGAGVAATEYRLGSGAFTRYDGPFTVAAPGEHLVEYRSVDRAGNAEATQSSRFAIASPPPTGGTGVPGPGPAAPRGIDDRRPAVRPMVRILAPHRTGPRASRLARRGLVVRLACEGAVSVRVALSVGARAARRLGLPRRTLARRAAPCAGSLRVRLVPRGRARRVVARARRPFVATIDARADGAPRARLRTRIR